MLTDKFMHDLDMFLAKEIRLIEHIDHTDSLPSFRLWVFDLSSLSLKDAQLRFDDLVDINTNDFVKHLSLFNLEIRSDFTFIELYLARRSVKSALHENLHIPYRVISKLMRKYAWFWLLPAIQASFSRQIATRS